MLVGGERINLGLPEVAPSGKGILCPISTCFAHLLHNIMGLPAQSQLCREIIGSNGL
jgi:hypothetical protein